MQPALELRPYRIIIFGEPNLEVKPNWVPHWNINFELFNFSEQLNENNISAIKFNF